MIKRIALMACTAAFAAADALFGYIGHPLLFTAHYVAPVRHVVHVAPVRHGYGIINAVNSKPIHDIVPSVVHVVHGTYDGADFCNSANEEEFMLTFGNVVEHTQKVAYELLKKRPFTSSDTFLDALDSIIDALTDSEKIGILEGHPDLAGRLADANLLTPESTRQQAEAGLHLLSEEEKSRLKSHNDAYRNKFGFTFIITARENKAAAILKGLDQRLSNTRDMEIHIGIGEVKKIAKLRARDILDKCLKKSKL